MKVLLAGSGGYIGSRLAARLNAEPDVTLLALGSRRDSGAVDMVTGRDALAERVQTFRPDAVVNCVGTISADPRICFEAHVVATTNLLEAVAAHAPGVRFVQLGSAAEYGQAVAEPGAITEDMVPKPLGPYGVSKLASTLIALHHGVALGLDPIVLRIFNLLGPDMSPGTIVPKVLRFLAEPGRDAADACKLGPLGVHRDFVHVDDVVASIVAAIGVRPGKPVGIVNIASGQPILVRELVRRMLDAADHRGPILEEAEGSARSGGVQWQRADISRAAATLAWSPRQSLDDSIHRLVRPHG